MNPEEKHMREDVDSEVTADINNIKDDIYQRAENSAEEYVSSKLGMDSDNSLKEGTKKQYQELFVEKVIEML